MKRAQRSTLRAADAGRAADDTTRAHQLANSARCLLELEAEIGRARALITEAGAIAGSLGVELCEEYWALGLLARWDGHEEEATSWLERALALARRDQDRWREYKCLTWLAMLGLERGRYGEMHVRCEELHAVAARVGEDHTPFVEALQALSALATTRGSSDIALTSALARLRAVDDKSYLAYALNIAALFCRRAARLEQTKIYASEALKVASVMGRQDEIAIARATLAHTGETASEHDIFVANAASSGPDDVSARARSALLDAATVVRTIPTMASTLRRQTKGQTDRR